MEVGGYDPGVRVLLCSAQRLVRWEFPNLSAPYWRFYWNDRPGATMLLGARRERMMPSRCYAVPPNTPFAARLRRPVVHFYLHFQAAPPYDAVAPDIFSFPADGHVLRTVSEARGLLDRRAGTGLVPRLALLCQCLACGALSRLPAEKVPAVRSDERVRAAVRKMEAGVSVPPSNGELAAVAGMHPNAFIRLFRGVTGRTPQAYCTVKRIERACLLLHGGSMSIKEIAARCGFCDRYHFSRVFKRLRGVGPAEFRRRFFGGARAGQ